MLRTTTGRRRHRVVGVVLALVLGLIAPVGYDLVVAPNVAQAATSRAAIVAVAAREIGYVEPPNECTKYDPGVCADWCAIFTNWVWRTAGASPVPDTYSARGVGAWGVRRGLFKSRPVGQRGDAQPGDIVVYGSPADALGGHVSLVASVNSDGSIDTIDGNVSNRVLRRRINPTTARAGTGNHLISGYVNPGNVAASTVGASSPAVVRDGELAYFGLGSGGLLRHWWFPPGPPSGYDHWGGDVAGSPTSLVFNGELTVFARGGNGALKHWWLAPGQAQFGTDYWWGAGIVGRPAAVVYHGELTVFALGTDGNLHHWWLPVGATVYQHDIWGPGGLGGAPEVVILNDQLTVFAKGANGTLMHWWFDGTLHSDNWHPSGGLSGDPAATVYNGQLTVFANGTAGQLHHWWFTNTKNYDTWASGGVGGSPTVAVLNNELTVFARGLDGSLQHWYYHPANGTHRQDRWLPDISGDPDAIIYNGQLTVFARGTAGDLRHWWFTNTVNHDSWQGFLA